ncbi:MAG: CocE/NonD family hydrolase [Pararhodobacter sp.]|nr:CocE/NonD family hydrolase [Pararhodobacter sp.]
MTTAPMPVEDTDDLFIPLPCGTRLAARMWRARGAEPGTGPGAAVPAILEFIPYRKRDNTLPRDEAMHPWMAAQGYACLRVDLRGAGDSEGLLDDEYSPQELADAVAVIEWIAAQDWCTGAVGMMGKSWGGFNCLQTAALAPPALKAVVSVCATVDRFADDIHFKGGCLLGSNFSWGSLMLSYQSRPPDPLLRPDWRDDWLARMQAMPHFAALWAGHQTRDAYWRHGSVCEDYGAIKAAVMIVGGWADGYMNAPAHLVENLKGPVAAIVGPWVHQYPHQAVPAPQVDFLGEMKRWWDHWLKGIDTGADALPRYRVWMQDSCPPDACAAAIPGRWLAEDLPSPRVREQRLTLGADGLLGGLGTPERVLNTPQTLGAQTGEYFPMGLDAEMPGDQRDDDARATCFDLPCPDGLALMGAARLTATLVCDGARSQIVARLCDVAPDGASRRIAHGYLNLTGHLAPGQPLTVALTLDQMAHRLAPGHRLRLALSTTDWPFVWPQPENARLRLTAGTLVVPVHDDSAPGCSFDAAPPVAPSRLEQLQPARQRRRLNTDLITGLQSLVVSHDSGRLKNPEHGWETESRMDAWWDILPDDPLSAKAGADWEQRVARGDWQVCTRVSARMTGSLTHLHLRATLTAFETAGNGQQIKLLERHFSTDVPRDHV